MSVNGIEQKVIATYGLRLTIACLNLIRYFLVISIPAETPVFSFIDHVIWRKLQASLLPVWVATPDVNVNFLYNVIHGKNGKAH